MKSKSKTTLSEERAAALAEMIEREDIEFGDPLPRDQWPTRGRGRPALSPSARGKSPQLTIRVSAELREAATARAAAAGVSMSDLARDALEAYLARPPAGDKRAARAPARTSPRKSTSGSARPRRAKPGAPTIR